jgi:hypothetical protein
MIMPKMLKKEESNDVVLEQWATFKAAVVLLRS